MIARIDGRQRLNVDERTRRSMLLMLELGLIRFEHPDFAPAIEEQHNGADPQDEHQRHDQDLLGADDYRGTVCVQNGCGFVVCCL